ncbi:MAG: hypothetical protein AAGA56_23445 [Myxococcota bacterium]
MAKGSPLLICAGRRIVPVGSSIPGVGVVTEESTEALRLFRIVDLTPPSRGGPANRAPWGEFSGRSNLERGRTAEKRAYIHPPAVLSQLHRPVTIALAFAALAACKLPPREKKDDTASAHVAASTEAAAPERRAKQRARYIRSSLGPFPRGQ